jgi:hypothetical protein
MENKKWYLLAGVLLGGILWVSVSTLIENNGLIAIIGLGFSCLVIGVGLGMTIGEGKKHE